MNAISFFIIQSKVCQIIFHYFSSMKRVRSIVQNKTKRFLLGMNETTNETQPITNSYRLPSLLWACAHMVIFLTALMFNIFLSTALVKKGAFPTIIHNCFVSFSVFGVCFSVAGIVMSYDMLSQQKAIFFQGDMVLQIYCGVVLNGCVMQFFANYIVLTLERVTTIYFPFDTERNRKYLFYVWIGLILFCLVSVTFTATCFKSLLMYLLVASLLILIVSNILLYYQVKKQISKISNNIPQSLQSCGDAHNDLEKTRMKAQMSCLLMVIGYTFFWLPALGLSLRKTVTANLPQNPHLNHLGFAVSSLGTIYVPLSLIKINTSLKYRLISHLHWVKFRLLK